MLEIVRWFFGYVTFEVIGKFPERFINIVTKNGLSIWNTKKTEEALSARMYVRDYKSIRRLCKKSRVRLKIKEKHGLPFFIRKYKSRVGVVIGGIVLISVVAFMSCFVWTIEVTGLKTISYTHLMQTLQKNGLYVGTYKPSVSFQTITRDTMLDIDDIGWMAINVNGSYASVEIKEKAKSPHVDDIYKPANVKAKCDGLIKHIDVKAGYSYFEAGSAVVKDQLIVGSVVESKTGSVNLVRANAKVIADTTHKKSFCIDKSQRVYEFAGFKERKSACAFGLSVPYKFAFMDDSTCAIRYTTKNPVFFDTLLPISVTSQRLYEKTFRDVLLSQQEATKLFEKQSALFSVFNLSDCTVNDIKLTSSNSDSSYIFDVTYFCTQDIAYQQEIDAENLKIEKPVPTESET